MSLGNMDPQEEREIKDPDYPLSPFLRNKKDFMKKSHHFGANFTAGEVCPLDSQIERLDFW